MANSIKNLLIKYKLINSNYIRPFHERVRDRKDIKVLRCDKSKIIFLSKTNHINLKKYQKKKKFRYFGSDKRKEIIQNVSEDTKRRKKMLKNDITNKKWLDFGTGSGAILEKSFNADVVHAVEPNDNMRFKLNKLGFKVFKSSNLLKKNYYDIISIFHVFEHLINPVKELKVLRTKLKKGGLVYIEVPHSKDFLIQGISLKEFKDFTFWSEHLILHTKESLKKFVEKSGFKVLSIKGIQRYTFTNHIYWLLMKKPKGHLILKYLNFILLTKLYEKILSIFNNNDTLLLIAEKR